MTATQSDSILLLLLNIGKKIDITNPQIFEIRIVSHEIFIITFLRLLPSQSIQKLLSDDKFSLPNTM